MTSLCHFFLYSLVSPSIHYSISLVFQLKFVQFNLILSFCLFELFHLCPLVVPDPCSIFLCSSRSRLQLSLGFRLGLFRFCALLSKPMLWQYQVPCLSFSLDYYRAVRKLFLTFIFNFC